MDLLIFLATTNISLRDEKKIKDKSADGSCVWYVISPHHLQYINRGLWITIDKQVPK